jgi:RNA polymerase sigma factor (sigma-70 family)
MTTFFPSRYNDENDNNDYYEDSYENAYEDFRDQECTDEEENENYFDEADDEDSSDDTSDKTGVEQSYYTLQDVDLQKVMDDYHSDDPAAVERSMVIMYDILKHYIFYVIKRKYSNYAKDYFEDMVQQACLGVYKGMQVYVPSRGTPSTFFHSYIVHEIQAFIDTEVHRTTAHYSSCIKKIKKVLKEYENQGLPCTPKDLEIETKFAPDTINQCLKIMSVKESSLDTALEDNVTLEAVLPSDDKTPEQEYIEAETASTILKALLYHLDERERLIVEMHFGLNGREQLSVKKISSQLGLPVDRINRTLSIAMGKLRYARELRTLKPVTSENEWLDIINDENVIPIVNEEDISIALEDFGSVCEECTNNDKSTKKKG